MNARSRVDATLALAAVVVALVVAVAGSDDGVAWLRWVLLLMTVGVLLRTLRSAALQRPPVVAGGATFAEAIDAEVRRCRRTGRPMSVVLCEIDGYAGLDADGGEGTRGRAERQVAELVRSSAREIDLVTRLGDGRFGILLPETPDANAAVVAERLRVAIARWSPQGDVAMTASFGVAEWDDGRDVLTDAEGALADAHAQGSDRVVVAGGDDLAS